MAIFKWNTSVFESKIKQNSENAVESMCDYLVQDVKASMIPGSFRPWPSKKGDGSIHYSSQPWEPPAPDTHELQDSISYSTSSGKTSGVGTNATVGNVGIPATIPNESVGIVGTKDIKGLWMELGVIKNMVEPRPFLRPAIPRNNGVLSSIFFNAMKIK